MNADTMYSRAELQWALKRAGLAKYLRNNIFEILEEEKEDFVSNLTDAEIVEETCRRR